MPIQPGPQAGIVPRISRSTRRNFADLLLAAIVHWLNRPPRPPDLPARLRMDVGLPPDLPTDWHGRDYDPPEAKRRHRPRR